jgi:hypothetical protein
MLNTRGQDGKTNQPTIYLIRVQGHLDRQLQVVLETLRPRWPKAAQMLIETEENIQVYMVFPPEHWKRI